MRATSNDKWTPLSHEYRGVIKAVYKIVFSVVRVRENNFSQRVIRVVEHEYLDIH